MRKIDLGQSLYTSASNFRLMIAENEEVARIWVNGRAGNELSPLEAEQFDNLCSDYFWRLTTNFIRNELLGESSERAVVEVRRELRSNPGLKECWDRRSQDFTNLRNAVEAGE